jgi:hypothetical protein
MTYLRHPPRYIPRVLLLFLPFLSPAPDARLGPSCRILMKNPACARSLKYCRMPPTAPYSLGGAFHRMPVRNTEKMPSGARHAG